MKPPKICYEPAIKTRPINHVETGLRAQTYRVRHKVILADVAVVIGLSEGQCSKLESGKKKWSEELFNRYCHAIKTLGKPKDTQRENDDCQHLEHDSGFCLDCGKNITDTLVMKAESVVDAIQDR